MRGVINRELSYKQINLKWITNNRKNTILTQMAPHTSLPTFAILNSCHSLMVVSS